MIWILKNYLCFWTGLEKCGFVRTGKDKGFANARQKEIEEYIYKLSD